MNAKTYAPRAHHYLEGFALAPDIRRFDRCEDLRFGYAGRQRNHPLPGRENGLNRESFLQGHFQVDAFVVYFHVQMTCSESQ